MKAEIWEYKLVQHLKLKDLREKKHDELSPKDVEKLVQISKQSKKLYQFYNEQICMNQFSYIKSKELLNSLFLEINQINQVSSLAQIPTLQQINSQQFIEIRNKKPSSLKLIDDPSILATQESKSSRSIKKNKLLALPSIFQQQKENNSSNENDLNDDFQFPLEISTDRKKIGKSQFMIMNILNGEENSKKQNDDSSNENISQYSDEIKMENEEENAKDQAVDIKQLEKKYLQKKQQREPTKFIYINSKKIEVKKTKNPKRTKKINQEQNSINKSSLIEGYDSHQNSIEKYYAQDSLNQGNQNNQIISHDHSLISQFVLSKTNEQAQNNLSILENEKYQSLNQLLHPSIESNILTTKTQNQIGYINNNNTSSNQDILIKNLNQKSNDTQQRISSYQNNLPYLSQLLDGHISQLSDIPSHDNTIKNNQIVSLIPSNQISMISSPHNNNNAKAKNYSQKDGIQKQNHQSFQINTVEKTTLNIPNKLELDDGILNNIFQKSKIIQNNSTDQQQQQALNKIQQEIQFKLPKNIQSLDKQRTKVSSLEKVKVRNLETIQQTSKSLLKQIQSPISNFNFVNKKLSLINLRGQPLYEKNVQGQEVGYFRTQLKESTNPLPQDYFYELLLKSQKAANLNKIKHISKQTTEHSSITNLNRSIEKKNLFKESQTINSNELLQETNKFIKYEQQQLNQGQQKPKIQQQQQQDRAEKSNQSSDTKLQQFSSVKKQDITLKNQIDIRLPSISETLSRRSKYTKFFQN